MKNSSHLIAYGFLGLSGLSFGCNQETVEDTPVSLSSGGTLTSSGGSTSSGGAPLKDAVGGSFTDDGTGASASISIGGTPMGGQLNASDSGGSNPAGGTAQENSSGGSPPTPPCLQFSAPETVGSIESFSGPSGMVASRLQPGIFYIHADAGSSAEFYAMDMNGNELAHFKLDEAVHTDWEDIAIGENPSGESLIYIGDFGDNAARSGGTTRSEIYLYRFKEPVVNLAQKKSSQTITQWEKLVLTYPDDVHDAEAFFIDPTSGDIIIITKEDNADFFVFRVPATIPPDTPTPLEALAHINAPGETPAPVSAGDISLTGDRVILRTLDSVLIWPHIAGDSFATTFAAPPLTLAAADEPQGEGITFAADGASWLSAGEQASTIYQAQESCPPE